MSNSGFPTTGEECGCCGGESACLLHSDDFARSAGEPPGSPWQEVAGDWEIAPAGSGGEVQTSDADAILLNETDPPEGVARFEVVTSRQGIGDEMRVKGAWQDEDNYWFWQFQRLSRGGFPSANALGEYTLWERSDGVNERRGSKQIGLFGSAFPFVVPMNLCWNGQRIVAGSGGGTLPQRWPTTATGKGALGVGVNSDGPQRFWSTELSKVPTPFGGYYADCPDCDEPCVLVHASQFQWHNDLDALAPGYDKTAEYDVTGTWSWLAGAVATSTNGALIAKPTLPSEAGGKGVAWCGFSVGCQNFGTPTDTGWKARFVFARQDAANYAYIERSKSGGGPFGGNLCHSIWQVQGGVHTRLTPLLRIGTGACTEQNPNVPIGVCWDGTKICTNVTGIDDDDLANSPKRLEASSDALGDRVGFESVVGNAVSVQNRIEFLTFWALDASRPSATLFGSPTSLTNCGCDCEPQDYYGGDSDPCCGEATLPGTLYLSGTRDGTPIQTDLPLDGGQDPPGNAGGFEYTSADELSYAICIGSLPNNDPDKLIVSIFDPDEGESITIAMTVQSCEPFYATGTREFGGFTYEVELTA
jgi:hypothetical protein